MTGNCPVCEAPLENDSCSQCGYRESVKRSLETARPASAKSQVSALLLCIFLGLFGAHRFYVGKTGTGLLYLFTGGLLGVGWIVDIFVIAAGCFTDLSRLPVCNAARR